MARQYRAYRGLALLSRSQALTSQLTSAAYGATAPTGPAGPSGPAGLAGTCGVYSTSTEGNTQQVTSAHSMQEAVVFYEKCLLLAHEVNEKS